MLKHKFYLYLYDTVLCVCLIYIMTTAMCQKDSNIYKTVETFMAVSIRKTIFPSYRAMVSSVQTTSRCLSLQSSDIRYQYLINGNVK